MIIKTKEFQTIFEKIDLEHATNFEFEISEYAMPILEKLFDTPDTEDFEILILALLKNSCNQKKTHQKTQLTALKNRI